MANGADTVSNVLTSVPIGEMVRSMALAIADAQFELDKVVFDHGRVHERPATVARPG